MGEIAPPSLSLSLLFNYPRKAADSNEISLGDDDDDDDSSIEVENAQESSEARNSERVCELQRFSQQCRSTTRD